MEFACAEKYKKCVCITFIICISAIIIKIRWFCFCIQIYLELLYCLWLFQYTSIGIFEWNTFIIIINYNFTILIMALYFSLNVCKIKWCVNYGNGQLLLFAAASYTQNKKIINKLNEYKNAFYPLYTNRTTRGREKEEALVSAIQLTNT